jgi:predicted HD phosphohydrolase
MANAEAKVDAILKLLTNSDHKEYFGEQISQLQHALQAAKFAADACKGVRKYTRSCA